MKLTSHRELANTQEKLRILEEEYEATRTDASEDDEVREVTMESLQRLINQLKEEIAVYLAHHQPAHR